MYMVLVWLEYEKRNVSKLWGEKAAGARPDSLPDENESEGDDAMGALGISTRSRLLLC